MWGKAKNNMSGTAWRTKMLDLEVACVHFIWWSLQIIHMTQEWGCCACYPWTQKDSDLHRCGQTPLMSVTNAKKHSVPVVHCPMSATQWVTSHPTAPAPYWAMDSWTTINIIIFFQRSVFSSRCLNPNQQPLCFFLLQLFWLCDCNWCQFVFLSSL